MPQVKIYSTKTCIWCAKTKEFLSNHGIKFKDIDVSKDKRALKEMVKKSGQLGIPVIEIKGRVIVGFDEEELRRLLKIKD